MKARTTKNTKNTKRIKSLFASVVGVAFLRVLRVLRGSFFSASERVLTRRDVPAGCKPRNPMA
jgi:hypothetical protein